jgi:anaerobic magnesium-protoporphyrin IX monomethyl ester cyclase
MKGGAESGYPMKILLLAMPDAANNFSRVINVPNLGLCSIAASLSDHDVRIADLVLVRKDIGPWLERLLLEFRPDLVGISSMSFQLKSAGQVVDSCRACVPRAKIVLGGYHATLQHLELPMGHGEGVDFLIRGEGERTFTALAEALQSGTCDLSSIPGLSWVQDGQVRHNPAAEALLDLDILPLPDRSARILTHFTYFNKKLDCVETSRGCTMSCNFCSISKMYGATFRRYSLDRVVADLENLRRAGVETVLIVDDNITLDVSHLKKLCEAIIENGLDAMEYIVQASVAGIAEDHDLAPLMAKANFGLVFLGIESVQEKNLRFLRKGDIREKTETALRLLRENGIAVMGGFMVGNPQDTREDIKEIFRSAKRLKVDLAVVQCVTPYPATRLREELLAEDLVTNPDDLSRYTGFMCNVRTRYLSERQLNRILNWENIKHFFSPLWFRDNYFVRKREKGSLRVMLNNLEYITGWFTGNQFRSRHRF